ncbi:CPBP family intramembrane metalloprotease [Caldicellulosiruptor changbaiensis]|uniref:CPBP family intramembrane metalloprotease n=1 Tax=Caldicellulosiruptor changbaiensis TaxID=1222016 RepID=A0A3T0D5J8_9FIRM|nr:type II CAAX endopeptidase family protein [Caldicellulosiruptor changbaiensis]AZT90314.1 CPBP family intramembrane metalloprotease [Caldicellulosiruptor changbaiensis]
MKQTNKKKIIKKKRSALEYISLFFVSGVLLPLIFLAFVFNMKEIYSMLLFYVFTYTCTILFFGIFFKDEITDLIEYSYRISKNKIKIINIMFLFLFGVLSTIIIQIIVYLLNVYLLHIRDVDKASIFEKQIENIIKLNNVHSVIILLTIIFFSGIVAPVVEEIIFRGLIFQSLRQKMDLKLAILMNALIFGLWHIDLYTALCAFLFGIVLSIFYIRFNSIFVPIVIHIGANIIGLTNIIISSIIK